MGLTAAREAPPLTTDERGVVRVGGTRVTLDMIVHAFDAGASPEEIVRTHPTLELVDAYATIAYLLRHRSEVDAYLAERATETAGIRQRLHDRGEPHQPTEEGFQSDPIWSLPERARNFGREDDAGDHDTLLYGPKDS